MQWCTAGEACMWVAIKQALLIFGFGKILLLLSLLSILAVILEVMAVSPLLIHANYLLFSIISGLTKLSL